MKGKLIKKLVIAVAVLAVVSILVVYFAFASLLNSGVKMAVEEGLPPITKTTVTLDSVKLNPFSGSGGLYGLTIGNPKGYKTDNLFKMEEISLAVDLGSMAQNPFVVKDITVRGMELTYEVALGKRKSNLTALQENIEASLAGIMGEEEETTKPATEEKPAEPAEVEEAGEERKIIINHFLIEDCTVRLSATFAQGKAATLKLPKIELNDIGRKTGGQTAKEAAAQIVKALGSTVRSAIANNKEFIKALGDKLPDAVSNITSKVTDKLDGVVPDEVGDKVKDKVKEGVSKLTNKLFKR